MCSLLSELKPNLAKLHNTSIVQHPAPLAGRIRAVFGVDPLDPLAESMGLDEFAILIFEIASVALREGGLDVVVPVHPAEFHLCRIFRKKRRAVQIML